MNNGIRHRQRYGHRNIWLIMSLNAFAIWLLLCDSGPLRWRIARRRKHGWREKCSNKQLQNTLYTVWLHPTTNLCLCVYIFFCLSCRLRIWRCNNRIMIEHNWGLIVCVQADKRLSLHPFNHSDITCSLLWCEFIDNSARKMIW